MYVHFYLGKGSRYAFPRCIPFRNNVVKVMVKCNKQETEVRDQWLPKTRVSKTELHQIRAKAKHARSLSDYIRKACRDAELIIYESKVDVGLRLELSRIGNNLNQLARRVHSTGEIEADLSDQLQDVLSVIQALLDR